MEAKSQVTHGAGVRRRHPISRVLALDLSKFSLHTNNTAGVTLAVFWHSTSASSHCTHTTQQGSHWQCSGTRSQQVLTAHTQHSMGHISRVLALDLSMFSLHTPNTAGVTLAMFWHTHPDRGHANIFDKLALYLITGDWEVGIIFFKLNVLHH